MMKRKEEYQGIARIRAAHSNKAASTVASSGLKKKQQTTMAGGGKDCCSQSGGTEYKEKVLKVSWEKVGLKEDYSAQNLRELFQKFGEVEDVVIRSTKKESTLVLMATKDAAVSCSAMVTTTCGGHLSNPLFVLPLNQPFAFPNAQEPVVPERDDAPVRQNLGGDGYQAFERSVLEKLRKV